MSASPRGRMSDVRERNVIHTASPSVIALNLREHTPVGKVVTLHFLWRMFSWWFVQALASVRIRVCTEQAVTGPCPNRIRRDAKFLGHLLLREESLVAQSFITTFERRVIFDQISNHLPRKESPVTGAMPVLVEYPSKMAGRGRYKQRVCLG